MERLNLLPFERIQGESTLIASTTQELASPPFSRRSEEARRYEREKEALKRVTEELESGTPNDSTKKVTSSSNESRQKVLQRQSQNLYSSPKRERHSNPIRGRALQEERSKVQLFIHNMIE